MKLTTLLPYLSQESKDNLDMMNKMGIELGQVVSDPRINSFSPLKEEGEGEVNVGGYQTQHFDVCPGATALYKDIESKGVDMDLASRTAKLQDVLFFIEKHVEEEGYDPNPYYGEIAQILGDQIMTMAGMMDLGSEHSYIQGHIDRIQSAVNDKSSVNEGKNDFVARHGKTNIFLKKGYKHHNETDLENLYNKLGKVVNGLKVKDINVVFESVEDKTINEANFRGKNWFFTTFSDGDIRGDIQVSKTAIWKLTNAGNSLGIGGQFTLMDAGKMRARVVFPKAGNLAQLAKRMYDTAQKETTYGVDKNIKEKDILDGLRGYYKAWASVK